MRPKLLKRDIWLKTGEQSMLCVKKRRRGDGWSAAPTFSSFSNGNSSSLISSCLVEPLFVHAISIDEHDCIRELDWVSLTISIENCLFLVPKSIQPPSFQNTDVAMMEPVILIKQWLVQVGLSHHFSGNHSGLTVCNNWTEWVRRHP